MPSQKRPNILFLFSDQHRYDAVSANGCAICQTPAIDRLAMEGMSFNRAYTAVALCTPARATIMSGLFPHNHGQLANIGNFNGVFDRQILNKPRLNHFLKQQGYQVGIAGKWHLPEGGNCGLWDVDRWHTEGEYHRKLRDKGIDFEQGRSNVQRLEWTGSAPFYGPSVLTAENCFETWVADSVIGMIDQFSQSDAPFMIHSNFFAPHFPYAVPKPFDTMYDPSDIPMWNNFNDMFVNKPTVQQSEMLRWNASHLTWPDWQKAIAAYYGYCTYMDTQIARILDALDARGLSENTLVIYTADHGDMLGSHRIFNKGMNGYEETHHIPFFARCPGRIAPGTKCDEFISLVDIMPTLLDTAGCLDKPQMDGCSILPLFTGDVPSDWRKDIFYEFHGYEPALCSIRAVRTVKWKYIYNPCSEDELYDMETDPGEINNLAPMRAFKHVLRRMKLLMVKWLNETGDSIVEEDSWKGCPYDLYITAREL
ncbi:sulfatase [Clostridia bacterium]|nr:sulfatase [Clostridia bacterium]